MRKPNSPEPIGVIYDLSSRPEKLMSFKKCFLAITFSQLPFLYLKNYHMVARKYTDMHGPQWMKPILI